MAPFNKRQIGYIQAVAGRQQHTTLVCGVVDGQLKSTDSTPISDQARAVRKAIGQGLTSSDDDAKSLFIHHWLLDHPERVHDSRGPHNDAQLTVHDINFVNPVTVGSGGPTTILDVFLARCEQNTYVGANPSTEVVGTQQYELNDTKFNSLKRATPDGYLRSTDVRFRFTLPSNISGTVMSGNNSGTGAQWFPTVDQLGITNTNPALGITVDQYKAFLNGHPNTATQSANFPDDGDLVNQSLADNTLIQSMINQYNSRHAMGQDHYEFRWIVWRNKRPTVAYNSVIGSNATNLEAIRDGASFRNPAYDFFVGQTGRKRGLIGYTGHPKLDSDNPYCLSDPAAEFYSGDYWSGTAWNEGGDNEDGRGARKKPLNEQDFTPDDLMTCRINRDDYVVMKDVRFFLGKEHGKSHFEDTLHWDWNEPIDTPEENVLSSPTLNSKNFRWHMTLIGTTNGKNPVILNQHVRWTTKMESG